MDLTVQTAHMDLEIINENWVAADSKIKPIFFNWANSDPLGPTLSRKPIFFNSTILSCSLISISFITVFPFLLKPSATTLALLGCSLITES
jgi:hypothetical protein